MSRGLDGFAGTGQLMRLILRLDRIKLSLWLVGLLSLVAITPFSLRAVLEAEATAQGSTAEQILIQQASFLETSGASIALQGPPNALDTFGGRFAFEIGAFALAIVALMNILLVARHTRSEEESGRADLMRALAVGRWSAIVAVSTVGALANLILAAGTAIVFMVDGQPSGPSIAYGLTVGLGGSLFGSIALIWVQVFEYGRAATGMSLIGLAAAFALRAVGDVRDNWLVVMSPLGWVQAVDPFGTLTLWPFGVSVITMILAAGLAVVLAARRDVGAGLIQPRPGPPHATPFLGTPFGLAWRLQRSTLGWWTFGVGFMGAVYGSVISTMDDFIEENEAMRDMLEAVGMTGDALRDGFITVVLSMTAIIATGGVVQLSLRARSEEIAGRAEAVLTQAVSRRAWLGAHTALVGLAAPVLMLAAALGVVAADGLVVGHITGLGSILGAAVVRVPALWAITGLGVFLYGFAQRYSLGVWLVFGYVGITFLFGELLRLPNLALNLSPLRHVTHWPAGNQGWLSVVVLCLVGAGGAIAGVALFERRDLTSN